MNLLPVELDRLSGVRDLLELAVPPGNHPERLHDDRSGPYAIRINDQYRICFSWENGYADGAKSRTTNSKRVSGHQAVRTEELASHLLRIE
jgi:plasmid maintenance system killer protein